jgi:arsenate reductase
VSTPVVLFACVHNGGRSLAGKVLTEHYSRGAVEARSAGSEPGDTLNPGVVAVLAERGLSTDGERPEPLTFDGVRDADVVITMGCGEACPAPGPGQRLEDWELEDPKGKDLETVRRIVDEVDARVRRLLDELGVPVTAGP